MENFTEILGATRQATPLVHFITNYVTVNDCANITLAAGGSPIMADDAREAGQIAGLCSALVLNIGTLSERTVRAMLLAGQTANLLGRPVILDPVGAGASDFRNDTALRLLREVRCAVIKGNNAEISFLAGGLAAARGVDAGPENLVTEENLAESARRAQQLAALTGAVIVISGPINIVADSREAWAVRNGHPLMARITGTGCMSAAVTGAFLGANPYAPLQACVCAMAGMGVCGELAHEKLLAVGGGNGTYRMLLLDAMSRLDEATLNARARVDGFRLSPHSSPCCNAAFFHTAALQSKN
ncbi:hydroxyethylthiazole kinase [uncultured Desulfovibrio sp.]|uniref:hydroxyethylthiazole kinase n=1 Tax=uncultured Desulfovibrio sp. TaxID=167968 RepID=UPI00258FE08E|nr:hydroxyethylthiazole kinase [uncultured Desulfovibrio sp.]